MPLIFWCLQRLLQLKKKDFDRSITELEQKAAEEAEANEVKEKLRNLIQQRQETERKLSTTYSLGRDGAGIESKPLLPMYDIIKRRSYSFGNPKKVSVALFHTLSETSSSSEEESSSWDSEEERGSKGKGIAKASPEDESSSSDDEKKHWGSSSEPGSSSMLYVSELFVEEEKEDSKVKFEESSSPRGLRKGFLKRRKRLSLKQ